MTKAEYAGNGGCPQRDSTECEGYAGARSVVRPENEERAGRAPELLEKILDRDNLNRAYKRVKANKGAPGVDGMTVEAALPWLKVNATKKFKFLGFAFGKGKNGFFIRVHQKSMQKAKDKLRKLTRRNRGKNVRQVMAEVKRYMQGWLNYYAIASMKNTLAEWNGWLRRRIRMYIWKQWKKPRTKYRNLLKLGIPEKYAWMAARSRRGYWFTVETGAVKRAISNERLARAGFFDLSLAYESIQSACVGRAVYRTVRTVR